MQPAADNASIVCLASLLTLPANAVGDDEVEEDEEDCVMVVAVERQGADEDEETVDMLVMRTTGFGFARGTG